MSERKATRELPLVIPPIPKDKLDDQFTWFWAALAVTGKENSVDMVSEPMEQSSPKLQEFIKRICGAVPIDEASDFQLGAHFVFNVLCFVPLPYLRAKTIRRFETEFKRWQDQVAFLLEKRQIADQKSRLKKAKDKLVTDFVLPTPAKFLSENPLLMKFLATRSPFFGNGGCMVYEMYTRELGSRRVDKIISNTK